MKETHINLPEKLLQRRTKAEFAIGRVDSLIAAPATISNKNLRQIVAELKELPADERVDQLIAIGSKRKQIATGLQEKTKPYLTVLLGLIDSDLKELTRPAVQTPEYKVEKPPNEQKITAIERRNPQVRSAINAILESIEEKILPGTVNIPQLMKRFPRLKHTCI